MVEHQSRKDFHAPLITNAFPFSLVRRKMCAEPIDMEKVINMASSGGFESAWRHENTAAIVSNLLGVDITPKVNRPAIELDDDKFPTLYGTRFSTIILISPDYVPGFGPQLESK